MYKTPIQAVFSDADIYEEVRDLAYSRRRFPGLEGNQERRALRQFLDATESLQTRAEDASLEAIVLSFGRPSLLIQDNEIVDADSEVWRTRLQGIDPIMQPVIPAVGRVELLHHTDFDWVGTGWMVDDNILVTNRHVANIFAASGQDGFAFAQNFLGQQLGAQVDFREEHNNPVEFEIRITDILYVAAPGRANADIAFLRVDSSNNNLPAPLTLAARDAVDQARIGVIGYPARDSRNDGPLMSRIFGEVYDVKRFAPGFVTDSANNGLAFTHDCTTLGGNSGSPVVNLDNGEAVGLHFAGRFRQANFAVRASEVRRQLHKFSPTCGIGFDAGPTEARRTPADYEDRTGYDENFLGDTTLIVPLPDMSPALRSDAVRVSSQRGMCGYSLDYTHFSVVMSKSRRLAIYTACNIDGQDEVTIRRRPSSWRTDPRIPREFQADNALYRSNPLDRGHLVRRLDPVWGTPAEASLAEVDTFHYTNAAPQHSRLNQRTWLALEDHLLDSAIQNNLRITVFTGPVFRESDSTYRDVYRIPQEFWKVVAMVAPSGELHATAYRLSQRELVGDLEFVFGEFRTYQTTIETIEDLTGLSFGRLTEFDPMGQSESAPIRVINGAEDLTL
jgi:endonuclease G, mitochondrial